MFCHDINGVFTATKVLMLKHSADVMLHSGYINRYSI